METLNYTQKVMIRSKTIIIDEFLNTDTKNKILELSTRDGNKVCFLSDSDMSHNLEVHLQTITKQYKDILFVFPGNGANYPKKLTYTWRDYKSASVYAKRFWEPGSNPVSIAGQVMPQRLVIPEFQTVVVIDDVISSGSTLRQIYKKNYWKFTRAKWLAAAWLSRPLDSKIKGYEQIFISHLVQNEANRKVPINSLSTLRQNQVIRESYAERHFVKAEKFINLIMSV